VVRDLCFRADDVAITGILGSFFAGLAWYRCKKRAELAWLQELMREPGAV
jgi:hypothetical protein